MTSQKLISRDDDRQGIFLRLDVALEYYTV